jgi:predicted dehydrogenase
MDKISAVLIGLGRIGSLLEEDRRREKPCTHAGAIAANRDCLLAGGADMDQERRRLFAEKWGAPVYADAETMLREQRPSLLVIATHPDSHAAYCGLAWAAGIPVVICEKPLADTLVQARRIARLEKPERKSMANSGSSRIKIIVNHERRYSADYIRAKSVLEEERLGRLLGIRGCLYMGRGRRLLDVLWHDGTHLADAIMFLSGGTLKHIRLWGAKLESREGTAYLEGRVIPAAQEPPIPVLLELGAGRDHLVFELEFSCEKGRVRVGNGVWEVWESAESPYAEGFRSLKNSGETFEGKTGYFTNMLSDAVACLRDPVRRPLSGASSALMVIEYLNAIKPWKRLN